MVPEISYVDAVQLRPLAFACIRCPRILAILGIHILFGEFASAPDCRRQGFGTEKRVEEG